jgi:hypothetical protein
MILFTKDIFIFIFFLRFILNSLLIMEGLSWIFFKFYISFCIFCCAQVLFVWFGISLTSSIKNAKILLLDKSHTPNISSLVRIFYSSIPLFHLFWILNFLLHFIFLGIIFFFQQDVRWWLEVQVFFTLKIVGPCSFFIGQWMKFPPNRKKKKFFKFLTILLNILLSLFVGLYFREGGVCVRISISMGVFCFLIYSIFVKKK